MQNVLLKRSILDTIVHFSLFCGITAGCNGCKGSVDKPAIIHPGKTSTEIPKAKVTLNEYKNEDEDDIKQKIEEELVAEQQRLEEEEKSLPKEEEIINPNYIQESSYNAQFEVEPSAPEFYDAPPPPYDSHGWSNTVPTSFPYNHPIPTSSNVCTDSNQDHNYIFDKDDLEDLRKNASTKRRMRKRYLNVNYKLRQKVPSWSTKGHMYKFKEKLEKLERNKTALEQRQNEILMNLGLSSKDRAKQLEDVFIDIETINYKIEWLKKVIEIIKQKNNKSDASTNEEVNPYPIHNRSDNKSLYPSTNMTVTSNIGNLYPSLDGLS